MNQRVVREPLRVAPPKPVERSQIAPRSEIHSEPACELTRRPYRGGRGLVPWLVGLGVVAGATLLARTNAYDSDVERYRDGRGRFRRGRFV